MKNTEMIRQKMKNRFNEMFKSMYEDYFGDMYEVINKKINVKLYEKCIGSSKEQKDLEFYMDCLKQDYKAVDDFLNSYIERYRKIELEYMQMILAFLPIKTISTEEVGVVFQELDSETLFNERVETLRVMNKSKLDYLLELIQGKNVTNPLDNGALPF